MEQSPSWEANRFAANQEIPRILWDPNVHARHLSLSWANSIQSIPPHPTSWRSVLILSSHPSLGLPCGLFPSGFHIKTLYAPLLFPIVLIPHPSHSSPFDQLNNICLSSTYHSAPLYVVCSFETLDTKHTITVRHTPAQTSHQYYVWQQTVQRQKTGWL